MPISDVPMSTNSSGAMPGMPSNQMFTGLPGMNIPMFHGQAQNLGNTEQSFHGIMGLLSAQPQSMTNSLMPGLLNILGLQSSSMGPMFGNQYSQMVSGAQSDAMRRGMTGSSLEAAGMLGARQAANYNQSQFMGQQLGQLGQQYQGAVGQDVNNQNQMYQNIAQAIGQQMANEQAMSMFQQQMEQQRNLAADANKAAMWGAAMGGAGAIAGGAMKSDEILKKDIRKVDEIKGLGLYEFTYRDDFNLDLPKGKHLGFMAQEVAKKFPQFVSKIQGFLAVDYIGLANALEA